jgi:hypothetical protein
MAAQKVLGTGRIAAVTAFLLSAQKEGSMKRAMRKDEPSQLSP